MNDPSHSNTYQVAGLDDRSRGFNRQATVTFFHDRYQAVFLYEQFHMVAEHDESESAAVLELVRRLHESGYRELRTRLHFRGKDYLGNQEPWEEHADPKPGQLWQKICSWIQGRSAKK